MVIKKTKQKEIRSPSESEIINNLMMIIPKEALVALLTQATPQYESATRVRPTRTGSSLFSAAVLPLKALTAIPDAGG